MTSVSQLLIAFLGSAVLVAGDGETQASAVKPTAAGYSYDVAHRNVGQWQPQYGYQAPVTGFRAGSSWPYNQDQYNAYGNKNWNSGQYSAYPTAVPAYGNRYSAFGTTGYAQGNLYGKQGSGYNPAYVNQGAAYNPGYGIQGTAYNPAYGSQGTTYNPAYGSQGTAYNPAYGSQGTTYNPAFGSRYQANPILNKPLNAYGSRTPNNPYNTPWLNAYSGQATGLNNAGLGYRNVGYQYNTASSLPVSTFATSTPKYNTFGTPGYSAAYNPTAFGSTGYGYNSVGFGATGQDYNTKYSAGSKQWADGRYSGDYGSQGIAKPYYQNQFTSPTYAPTSTGYGKK